MTTSWALKTGATLLIPSGPAYGQMHLHVLLNDPKPMDGFGKLACALACFCSVPKTGLYYDATVEFPEGHHPFFKHQTYVSYKHFQVMPAAHIIARIKDNTYIPKINYFSLADVQKIINGYTLSGHTPQYLEGLTLP